MVSKGSYCLCIRVDRRMEVEVGAIGINEFKPGCYIYVGSALSGLEARIRRHLNTSRGLPTAVHWHIDYLLKEDFTTVEAVYTLSSDKRVECSIASAISEKGIPVKGFGSSDCHCDSHLFKVEDSNLLSELGLEQISISNLLGKGSSWIEP